MRPGKHRPARWKRLERVTLLTAMMAALMSCCQLAEHLRGNSDDRPPNVPAPPAAMAMPAGKPAEQVAALATALADPKRRLAAWLRVYEQLGIPVLSATGAPIGTVKADVPGPYFWQVWYMSGLDKAGTGVPLSDVGRMFALGLPAPPDSRALAEALLADLRASAGSNDPAIKLFGLLVRERILRGRSRADILDPKTTIDVVVDLPTIGLMSWVALRATLAQVVVGSGPTGAWRPEPAAPEPRWRWNDLRLIGTAHAASGGFKCSELLGSKDTTEWVKGITKFLAGGGKLKLAGSGEKIGFSKTSELLAKALGMTKNTVDKIGKAVSWANAVSSILSFAMQMDALELRIDSQPDTLERTKRRAQGKEQKHRVQIVFDTEGRYDGNELRSCLASFALNVMGVSLKIPENGKALAKVQVLFKAGAGFDRVMFGDYKQLKQDTDAGGYADLLVVGRPQKTDIPDKAKAQEAEYSFFVESQMEEESASSIANMFWGSLKAVGNPGVAGAVGPILQLLKVMHWSLGEQSFLVIDWKPAGWKVDGRKDEAIFSGEVCDLEKPFRVKISGGASGLATYTPNSGYPLSGGTLNYSGRWANGTIYGNGTYKLSGDAWTQLKITQSGPGCVTSPLGSACDDGEEILTLTPIDTCSTAIE